MYVVPEAGVALIRIPKTGSTSAFCTIRAAHPLIQSCGDGHETYGDYVARCVGQPVDRPRREHTKQSCYDLRRWRVIGFVRHPLTWLPSLYALLQTDSKYSQRITGGPTTGMSPSAFIDALTMTPYDWLTVDGNVCVTEVWRMEDLDEFAASFGVSVYHENHTKPDRKFDLDWTPRDLRVIKEKFRRELTHYAPL